MSTQSLVHDVHRNIIAVSQVPQQVENLVGHHTVLVVLSQAPDQFKQLLALLLACVGPARLHKRNKEVQSWKQDSEESCNVMTPKKKRQDAPCSAAEEKHAYFETVKKMIELLR